MISTLASVFPLSFLKKGKYIPVLLPFYHMVSDEHLPFKRNYDYPTISRFKEDLDFLLSNFKAVSLNELLSGKNLENTFHLTFDDGLRSCFEIIAPILKQKGIPATFFVNPAFVDNKDLFHRYKASILHDFFQKKNLQVNLENTYADIDSLNETAAEIGIDWQEYLQKEKPYMNLEHIKSLQDEGFSIGAHSWDHPEFWLLDAEQQLDEIRESMNWITENLSPSIKAFAFPFSDIGVKDDVFQTIQEEKICAITFGTAGLKREIIPFHFQRVAMDAPAYNKAKKRIKTAYFSYLIKKILNKHVAKRSLI